MPTELLWTVRATPVFVWVNVILALGTAALVASNTVPRTTPRPVWETSGDARRASRTMIIRDFLTQHKKVGEHI
jgi:hypothetical protein